MSVTDLLAWANGLPLWQQDALRRIAQKAALSDTDVCEIRRNLDITHGLVEGELNALSPLTQDHLPVEKAPGSRTILRSIGDIRNANRLAEGQTLRFAINGITLVYGDNGSGKSGYCRIAKAVCRARAVDPILGDVFDSASPGPPSAKVRFQIEGSGVQEADWQDGQPAPDATSRISVFDSRSAALYVDEKNRIEFLPPAIDIVRQLGQLCATIGEQIKNEISIVNQRLASTLPIYTQGTEVASIIDALRTMTPIGSLPATDDILVHATWTDADEGELQKLEKELACDPRVLAEQRERCEASCQSLARELEAIETVVGNSALSDLQPKYTALVKARQVALIAASQLSSEPLHHVGSEPWRRLFEYAKEYSVLAYPDVPPPATREGDRCVLCQQLLSPEASDRLRRFEDFVSGNASQEAAAAERELRQAVNGLTAVVIPATSSVEQRLAEYGETSPARKAGSVLLHRPRAPANGNGGGCGDGQL